MFSKRWGPSLATCIWMGYRAEERRNYPNDAEGFTVRADSSPVMSRLPTGAVVVCVLWSSALSDVYISCVFESCFDSARPRQVRVVLTLNLSTVVLFLSVLLHDLKYLTKSGLWQNWIYLLRSYLVIHESVKSTFGSGCGIQCSTFVVTLCDTLHR